MHVKPTKKLNVTKTMHVKPTKKLNVTKTMHVKPTKNLMLLKLCMLTNKKNFNIFISYRASEISDKKLGFRNIIIKYV